MPTGETKQSHGFSSCIALPKLRLNEINVKDIHTKAILIYVVTGSGCGQRDLYTLNLSLHIHYRAGQGILPGLLPAHPASAYKVESVHFCFAVTFKKYLCIETMDPATAWGSWCEGGWQCLPGSIPFTTYYTKPTYHTKLGHGEGGSGTERQRSWERVWSRSLMMSNPRSWGCLAWRKKTEGRPYFSLQLPKRSLKRDGGKFLTSSNKEQDEVA